MDKDFNATNREVEYDNNTANEIIQPTEYKTRSNDTITIQLARLYN